MKVKKGGHICDLLLSTNDLSVMVMPTLLRACVENKDSLTLHFFLDSSNSKMPINRKAPFTTYTQRQ